MRVMTQIDVWFPVTDEHLHLPLEGKPNGMCVKSIRFAPDDSDDPTVYAANRMKDGRCYGNGMPEHRLMRDPEVKAIVADALFEHDREATARRIATAGG